MKLFNSDLVFLDVTAETSAQVIKFGGEQLKRAGIVKDSYIQFVLDREKESPTGIPTEKVKVSLPHTEAEHVIKSGAAFIQLKKPVSFISMEDLETELPVELVFQLALADGHQQLSALKELTLLFNDSTKLERLCNASTKEEVMDILDNIQITE